MLARREQAYGEKRTLESQIDDGAERIRDIEAQLGNGDTSTSSTTTTTTLEDRLVQLEMQMVADSSSLAALNEEIHGLEIDHYSLIRTRRRLENEALRYNGLRYGWYSGQRAKSLMQLSLTSSVASGALLAAGASTVPQTPTSPMTEDGDADGDGGHKVQHRPFPGLPEQRQQQQHGHNRRQVTYDSSQSMEHSSDGGISSQSGSGEVALNDGTHITPSSPLAIRLSADNNDESDEAVEHDDDNESYRDVSDISRPVCCRMQALRNQIAFEKATLMKNLEVNSEKRLLDEGIDRLQELQRRFVVLEKRLGKATATDAAVVCPKHQAHHDELQKEQRLQQQQQQQLGATMTAATSPVVSVSSVRECMSRSMQSIGAFNTRVFNANYS